VTRKNLLIVAIVLGSMLAGVALYHMLQTRLFTGPAAASQVPLEIHSIPLTDLDQQETVLSDWQGNILLVNFWAPWCAPCRREIPSLIKINDEFAARGVRILGVAFDGADQVRNFADEYNIDYPLFLATSRAAMYNVALGNPSGSLPYTAILNRKLEIIYQHNGEVSLDELRTQLEKSL